MYESNFWSWFDHTPKGVTIHYMDVGIDTGPILYQRGIKWQAQDLTLRDTYVDLQTNIVDLFRKNWPEIRAQTKPGIPQEHLLRDNQAPTSHRRKDALPFLSKLPLGWDTPVSCVEEMGLAARKVP